MRLGRRGPPPGSRSARQGSRGRSFPAPCPPSSGLWACWVFPSSSVIGPHFLGALAGQAPSGAACTSRSTPASPRWRAALLPTSQTSPCARPRASAEPGVSAVPERWCPGVRWAPGRGLVCAGLQGAGGRLGEGLRQPLWLRGSGRQLRGCGEVPEGWSHAPGGAVIEDAPALPQWDQDPPGQPRQGTGGPAVQARAGQRLEPPWPPVVTCTGNAHRAGAER